VTVSLSELTPILLFAAAQTGALIFFAGVVAFTLKDHARRHSETETKLDKVSLTVAKLAQKEGIS
jgi:hypothetical protein